jgi:hypothetical protein
MNDSAVETVFLIIIAATGRDVLTLGYSLNHMEFLTGFHGKSLSGKKPKK